MQAIVDAEMQKQNAQVCRHYLQGECRRADCWVKVIIIEPLSLYIYIYIYM
jgi:hypothetical protein